MPTASKPVPTGDVKVNNIITSQGTHKRKTGRPSSASKSDITVSSTTARLRPHTAIPSQQKLKSRKGENQPENRPRTSKSGKGIARITAGLSPSQHDKGTRRKGLSSATLDRYRPGQVNGSQQQIQAWVEQHQVTNGYQQGTAPTAQGQSNDVTPAAPDEVDAVAIATKASLNIGPKKHTPWSLTEPDVYRAKHRKGPRKDEESAVTTTEHDELATPVEKKLDLDEYPSPMKKYGTLQEWLNADFSDSDEYDTDLEEDFPPEPEEPPDASGANVYSKMCDKKGIVPVSFLIRNLGDSCLRMRHHYLGGEGTKPLAAAFKQNTVTEEIDLADNYVEGEGAAALASMLKDNMFIINMNVSNNFIGSEGAEAFSEMLEVNTTLKTLSLQGNQLTDTNAKRLSEAIKNNLSLACLDLSHNRFGELGGIYLGAGLSVNVGLNDLDLSWNAIRQKGGVALAKALHTNNMLEILDLSWNGLGYMGAAALAKALRVNKKLKVLDISHNRINSEAAKVFAKGLSKNTGLETLLLGQNSMDESAVDAILKAVSNHPTLRLLGLEDITVSPALQQKITALEESRDIMIMYSGGSPQQAKVQQSVMLLFDRFISDNSGGLQDLFNQLDKDNSGDLTLEELKFGLKDQGLRLTSKQLDMLLDMIDTDKSGTIEYSELMNGLATAHKEKARRERAIEEAKILASAVAPNLSDEPSSIVAARLIKATAATS